MHLGNAFSLLLAWLSCRSDGGEFILRMEDLDRRCDRQEYHDVLIEDMRWLGLDWDGDIVVQSSRLDAYDRAKELICSAAEVYPCFCTRADLHAASAPHASDGTPLYAGTCYGLSAEDVNSRLELRKPALRLHVPDRIIEFADGNMGPYSQSLAHDCGDFLLQRSDGIYAYQLVCVVDDIESGITQVVRGSDLLSSTPRQMFLYELLGAQAPQFFHHPLLLAEDGRRLSKRDADLEIARLRADGVQAEELIGKLARLAGLLEREEPVCAHELIEEFSWEKVPTEDIICAPGNRIA